MGGSIAELTSFLREQQQMQMKREERLEAKLEAQRLEMEAQRREAEARRAEVEALRREELEARLVAQQAISTAQRVALQSRIEALHAAQLLSDDEFYTLEDVCCDVMELETVAGGKLTTEMAAQMAQTHPLVAKACKMVGLAERLEGDAALARQLRRKFA